MECVLQRLAEEETKLGHEVHVISSQYGATGRPCEEVLNGVHVHRIKAWRLNYSDLSVPWKFPLEVIKRADILQAYSQNSLFNYLICLNAKRMNTIIATYFLGVNYALHYHNPIIKTIGGLYQNIITKNFVKITDIPLVTNEYEFLLMRELYDTNAYIVPHGVDEDFLYTPSMKRKFLQKYEIEGEVISYLGRIDFMKGIDLLIRAFALISRDYPDVMLVIAGSGNRGYLDKCSKLADTLNIRSRVKFIGYIFGEDKIGLIDASTVLVIPTRAASESYPLVMDEVAARGKPIIFSDASKPVAYKIIKEKRGFIFNKNNYKELANIIKLLLDRKVEFKPGIKPLTWKNIALMLLKLYNKVIP